MRSKIWGGFLLAAIIAIAMPVFVNATTVDKNSTTIFDNPDSPKVLIVLRDVTGVKNYVQASFGYELVEDENNPAPVNNLPSGPLVLHIGNTPSDETHKVTGSMSITMANVEFSELGDYKFILREISSSDADNYPVDTEHEYYIYVSVRNELAAGVPTGNLVATLSMQARNHDQGEKTSLLFTSEAVRTQLSLSKNVTGNLADTEEYFKFQVRINGRTGDTYTINGQDDSVSYDGETVDTVSTFVVGDDAVDVYLRHGQTITIGAGADGLNEIPIGVTYVIVEADAEDYTTTVDESEGKSSAIKTSAVLLDNDALPESNQTNFVNHKESAVLTGVTLAIIPAAILIVAMFTGAVIVRKVKKNSSNKR